LTTGFCGLVGIRKYEGIVALGRRRSLISDDTNLRLVRQAKIEKRILHCNDHFLFHPTTTYIKPLHSINPLTTPPSCRKEMLSKRRSPSWACLYVPPPSPALIGRYASTAIQSMSAMQKLAASIASGPVPLQCTSAGYCTVLMALSMSLTLDHCDTNRRTLS